jgi:hypothetical protein
MEKKGFSLEQHQTYAEDLCTMYQQLDRMAFEVSDQYGKSAAYFARKAQDAVDSLRKLLGDAVYVEHPELLKKEEGFFYLGS